MKKTVLALAMLAGMTTVAQAAVTVTATNGTPQTTTALTGFATSGDEMVGMQITGVYGGSAFSATWAANGSGCGIASNAFFSVSQCGDTFSSPWTLSNTGTGLLTSLSFLGVPGRTVFDRTNPSPGTGGSANGADFALTTTGPDIDVTYTDILRVPPGAAVGDLYTRVNLLFNGGNGWGGGAFSFIMDADNARTDIVQAPEPGSLLLMGLGLAALGAARRRRA
jgi:hypothetical protein